MAHLHKKTLKGKTYWYLRQMHRVDGRVKVKWQKYLGSPETIFEKLQAAEKTNQPVRLQSESFGALFVAYVLEKQLDTIGIIDSVVRPKAREKGPSVGEYFFYAWANRLVDPKSKRALGEWYRTTAIQHIRPVDIKELTSMRYWEKWDRVSAQDIEKIGKAFFDKVWATQELPPECVLFDTSNYYTYMASHTDSELCQRGKNKASKHHLRQVGLALLVDRETQLPLYYKVYEGNRHDSKVFQKVIDEMFGVMCDFNRTKQRLTIVFDKGMNSDDNIGIIDDHHRIHFITTYSPYFVEELATMNLKHFSPVTTRSNLRLEEDEKDYDKMTAYRTKLELWGKERTVVVTHSPISTRKKQYTLNRKLETLREALLEFRRNYRESKAHWQNPDEIKRRYERLCGRLHIESQYYDLDFGDRRCAPEMTFKKNIYQIQKSEASFGRNIIVTDNHDWTTDEIVQLSLDRYFVEKQFRAANDRQHISMKPFFHWTDSKIRCQLLSCVIALTVMRLFELKLESNQIKTPLGDHGGPVIMKEMRDFHCILSWKPHSNKPDVRLETPTTLQNGVLSALGYRVKDSWVLQATL